MNPLDELLSRYITPELRSSGFMKKGRLYIRYAPNDDCAVIGFQSVRGLRGRTEFFVEYAIVPETMRRYSTGDSRNPPHYSQGVFRNRRRPPDELAGPLGGWSFEGSEGLMRLGRELALIVTDDIVPFLARLLDREALLEELNSPTRPNIGSPTKWPFSELILRVDEAEPHIVERLISEAETALPGDDLAAWARQRLTQRRAAE